MRKLPAFTVIELIVVMILIGIVMGFVTGIFMISQGNLSRYKRQNDYLVRLKTIEWVLQKDADEAEYMTVANGGEYTMDRLENPSTYRIIADSLMQRKDVNRTDNFVFSHMASLSNAVVPSLNANDGLLIESIQIAVDLKETPIIITKQYSAAQLMEYEDRSNGN